MEEKQIWDEGLVKDLSVSTDLDTVREGLKTALKVELDAIKEITPLGLTFD